MNGLKHGTFYLAFTLGACNSIVGMFTLNNYSEFYEEFSFVYHSLLYSSSYCIGCLISESYYSKWNENYAILLLWVVFVISNVLVFLISLKANLLFQVLSSVGYVFSSIAQAILVIVEIGYITAYMKQFPDSFALPLLLSLTQFCFILSFFLDFLSPLMSLLIFFAVTAVCMGITWKFTGVPIDYPNKNCSRYIILPFAAFALEFYVFGVSSK